MFCLSIVKQTANPFLSHQCSSQMRQILVEMALQISTLNIIQLRRIQVKKSMLNTIISGLMCGLVLWVLVCRSTRFATTSYMRCLHLRFSYPVCTAEKQKKCALRCIYTGSYSGIKYCYAVATSSMRFAHITYQAYG
jgi:hypothetical protein